MQEGWDAITWLGCGWVWWRWLSQPKGIWYSNDLGRHLVELSGTAALLS